MQIKTLAQLSKIADVCRKKGIESIKITEDTVEFKLKEDKDTRKRTKKHELEAETLTEQNPSEEEILFWSSTGLPQTSGH